ncbi:hypothetical protein FGB62_2g139 [Gracilaria domingensis]|nr:hypothetical protein FGB62_2g139 [Gracilaria domingensis]
MTPDRVRHRSRFRRSRTRSIFELGRSLRSLDGGTVVSVPDGRLGGIGVIAGGKARRVASPKRAVLLRCTGLDRRTRGVITNDRKKFECFVPHAALRIRRCIASTTSKQSRPVAADLFDQAAGARPSAGDLCRRRALPSIVGLESRLDVFFRKSTSYKDILPLVVGSAPCCQCRGPDGGTRLRGQWRAR